MLDHKLLSPDCSQILSIQVQVIHHLNISMFKHLSLTINLFRKCHSRHNLSSCHNVLKNLSLKNSKSLLKNLKLQPKKNALSVSLSKMKHLLCILKINLLYTHWLVMSKMTNFRFTQINSSEHQNNGISLLTVLVLIYPNLEFSVQILK